MKRHYVKERANEVVNRLYKTKVEKSDVDFYAEKLAYTKETSRIARNEAKRTEAERQRLAAERKRDAEARSYDRIMSPDEMVTNHDRYKRTADGNVDVEAAEEDFM